MFTVREDTDLRRHQRFETATEARVSVDGVWYACTLSNISGGGAFIEVSAAVEPGQAVVLMADDLGLLAATVQRVDQEGLSLTFGVSGEAREDLTDRLTAFLNAHLLS